MAMGQFRGHLRGAESIGNHVVSRRISSTAGMAVSAACMKLNRLLTLKRECGHQLPGDPLPAEALTDTANQDSLNPYAVTTGGDRLSPPIHFGGTATRDDLMMSLHDSPPKSGLARFQYPFFLVLILIALVGLNFVSRSGEPIASIAWTLLAFLLLPGWLALVRHFSPTHQKRVSRLEVMATHQHYSSGWLDDEYFVDCDENTALRARWTFFSGAHVFPTHLLVPLATDASRRVILPLRFFSSAADVRQVCQFLSLKIGLPVNQPPNDKQLASIPYQSEPLRRIDVEQARQWNSDQWPFQCDSDEQHDWHIDLTAKQSSRLFTVKAALAVLLLMLWYFLPIWLGVVAWLANDYSFYGRWDFLYERPISSGLVLAPAGFLLGFFVFTAIRQAVQIRRAQSQPLLIRLREVGIHLSHANFDSWSQWSAVESVIAEDKFAGWVVRESMEDVRFPAVCFESEESFHAIKSTLQSMSRHGGVDPD